MLQILLRSFDSHPPELRPLTTVSGKIFYTDKARRPMVVHYSIKIKNGKVLK